MKKVILYLAVIAGAVAAGLWSSGALSPSPGPNGKQEQPPPPVLVFDSRSLDIGEVWEDRAFKHTVRVENRGPETIHVDGVSCSTCNGGVFAIDPQRFELVPGASRTVQVNLNLTLAGNRKPESVPFAASLRMNYTTPSNPGESQQIGSTLHGAVKPVLAMLPVWNLGTHLKASGPIERRFEVTALVPLGSLNVDVLEAHQWQLTVSARRRPSIADKFDILVRSEVPAISGQCVVVLRPRAADGTALPAKHVLIELEVTNREIRASPAEVYFGGAKVGATLESLVSLSSRSGKEFQVEKAEAVGPGLQVIPGVRPNEFKVTQRIMQMGPLSGVVTFAVRTKNGVDRIDIAVSAVGVEIADK